jgi:hypothetical protein
MQGRENTVVTKPRRMLWNKGKLIGAKPPLRPKHVWSIRTKLQEMGWTRDLAMFNLAIDSKLAMSSPSMSRMSLRVDMQSIGPRSDRKRRGSPSGSSWQNRPAKRSTIT